MLGLGSSVPAFSPPDIAGLDWWLVADTIAGSDGDPVVDWADNTGNAPFGNDTVGEQPTIKVSLYNGHRAVRFGANKCLVPDPSARTLAAANTLICVCTESEDYIIKGNGGQGGPALITGFGSAAFEYFFTATAGHERASYASSPQSGLHIITVTKTDDVGNYVGYYDGVQVFSNPIHTGDDWDPRELRLIGAFTRGSSTYAGDITEILHWPSVLSGANLTLVHNYLKAKYGIA
jgi:hypothetical protein